MARKTYPTPAWQYRLAPGQAGEFGEYDVFVGPEGEELFIARTNGGTGHDEANARLIAAAPEMLETLRTLKESFEAYIDTKSIVNADIVEPLRNASAIIAKAEGRKSHES